MMKDEFKISELTMRSSDERDTGKMLLHGGAFRIRQFTPLNSTALHSTAYK
jgi:hypothetical protein